jgi:hypothetical protein
MQADICPIADQFVKAFADISRGPKMKRLSDAELKRQFLAWQCRIRQTALRNSGGAPPPGARPRVLERSGKTLLAAMTVLIVPRAPRDSTAFFRFQVSRSHDPREVYRAGVNYLAETFYAQAELFSDELTALFKPESETALRIAAARSCLLDFEQHSRRFTLACRARQLRQTEAAYEATWWHNRIFNTEVPAGAIVLAFKPDWKSAKADPWPDGC